LIGFSNWSPKTIRSWAGAGSISRPWSSPARTA